MVLGRGKSDRSAEAFDSRVGTWRWEDKLGFGADLWSCTGFMFNPSTGLKLTVMAEKALRARSYLQQPWRFECCY
jgi:hypothetical protein